MLNPRAVALQGIGSAALVVALQGFAAVAQPDAYVWDTSQGMAPAHSRRAHQQLMRDDEQAVDMILALLTSGFFHGNRY